MQSHRQPHVDTQKVDWERSDAYHNSFLIPSDPVLDAVNENMVKNGLPDIAVSTAQGKLLQLLVKSINAKRIIEVGTLGGYSAICMGRALPGDGKLVTLELDAKHVEVARANIDHAGLSNIITVVHGPADESLAKMNPDVPFDLAFIDADKPGNKTYFHEAKRLVKSGGVIIVDNVVRYGKVHDQSITDDAAINGVRTLLEYIKGDAEVEATTIATVGEKGYDGFLYAVRK